MFLTSLYLALLNSKIWQTTETFSPQTFSVTVTVVAQAVVICFKLVTNATRGLQRKAQQSAVNRTTCLCLLTTLRLIRK